MGQWESIDAEIVALSNGFAMRQHGAPVGGWASLSNHASNAGEMQRRIGVVLSVFGASDIADRLQSFAGTLASGHLVGAEHRVEHQAAEPGPAEEKWVMAPGVTMADVDAAKEWLKEHRASSSPIEVVAQYERDVRLAREAEQIAEDALDPPVLTELHEDAGDGVEKTAVEGAPGQETTLVVK